jgi:hypothetical protein
MAPGMSATTDTQTRDEARRRRLRFELIFASACIGFGLLLLPALIYWIGAIVLGAYGENAGVGTFYLDFFRDLAEPTARAWALLLGPWVTLSLLRGILRRPAGAEEAADPPAEPVPPPAGPRRVEPRLGAD